MASVALGNFRAQRLLRRFALIASALLVVIPSAAAPTVRKNIVVPLRLPWKYEPATLPALPIDDQLRVGLVLPIFELERNATWTTPVGWATPENNLGDAFPKESITEVDQIFVNAAEPVARALPKMFRRLFPRSEVVPNRYCPACDLIFVVKAESRAITNGQNEIEGVKIEVSMTALVHNVVMVTSFSGTAFRRKPKSMYWSSHTLARGWGEPALIEAMEQLFARLVASEALKAFIADKTAERARPSNLETTVAFDDATSFFPNGSLDAGEHARLRFTLKNQGEGPAFAVRLRLGMTAKAITMPADVEVGDIPRGDTKQIDVPISAGIGVETAMEQLRVETVEKRGYGGRALIVRLATEQLRHPTLEIADIRLEDQGGRARGDGDGRPSNGETIEAVILIRNSGRGDAVGASLTIAATAGVEMLDPAMNVGVIAANAVKEVRALFHVPVTFTGPDLELTLRAIETRGPAVAAVDAKQRWPLQLKRPRVEIGFRLFDGNSPQSTGNRDSVANNGEVLDVALIPSNRGALTARGVRLTVASPIAGIRIKPSSIDVGDLPPLAEGVEHRLQLTIPRSLGRDDLLQRLSLNVTIDQADFPADGQSIGLPFNAQRPALIASLISQSPVVEGKPALFALDIRNSGSLAAEDVKVEISSSNPAVELLDALGTPAQTVRFVVGSIAAGMAAGRFQIRAQIKRNVVAVSAMLNASVAQRDFGTVTAQTGLSIVKEGAALISIVPPSVPTVIVPRAVGVPATVSFQHYRDGSRVADEAISLPFEVQSQAPIETVRLEQNHRRIELPQTAPVQSGETYAWQYEPQVHLEYGANEFEVVVITSGGIRNSRAMTLHREKPRGKIWLAVVGISKYREASIADLGFAKNDAVAVREYYRQLGVPDDQIIELLDEDATLAGIKRSLGTELVRQAANPDDTVLIYFAGHGQMEADRSSADSDGYSKYLLPHDANPSDLFGSALSMEELSRILQRLRAERVVLMIDSCFSGAAGGRTPFEPNAAWRGVISEEFLSRMANGTGRVILTASGSREVARESSETRHGIFTYFLLEGLRGAADADHDGRIDVDEIYRFVSVKVSSATRGQQNPMRKSPNLTGILVLGGRLQ